MKHLNIQGKIAFLLLTFLFIFSGLSAQDKMELPVLSYNNNMVFVSYSLHGLGHDYFNVSIEARNSENRAINIRSVHGDIGQEIKAGKNKQIIWNLAGDNLVINDNISIRVISTPSARVNKSKLLISSTIIPGLGQSKYYKNYSFLLFTVASAGCLASSVYLNNLASENYHNYSSSTDNDLALYNKAVSQNTTSKTLAYAAAGIWFANIIWTAALPKYFPQSRMSSMNVYPVTDGMEFKGLALNLSFNLQND